MKTKSKTQNIKSNKNKLVLIPLALLLSISSFLAGTKYEKQIKDTIENQPTINKEQILDFTKEATVKRVIDGDTIELASGQIVRLVGVNAPDNGQPYDDKATDFVKKLIEERKLNWNMMSINQTDSGEFLLT